MTKPKFIDRFINPSFQGVSRLTVLLFEDNMVRVGQSMFSSDSRNKRLQCYD